MFGPTLYNVSDSKLVSTLLFKKMNRLVYSLYTPHVFYIFLVVQSTQSKAYSTLSSTILSKSVACYIQWSLQNVQSSPVYKSSYRAANLVRRLIEKLNVWWNILINIVVLWLVVVLYTNIDLKLRNKSHGPMHYKIGVTCVYNGHVFYTML